MSAGVERIELHRLRLPLAVPYHLSFATLREFELVLARVWIDGREGLGECVPLPVYSHESADTVWRSLSAVAPALHGLPPTAALARLDHGREASPFAAAPLMTAIEHALAPDGLAAERRVPLLAPVGRPGKPSLAAARAFVDAGYRTLKVKVGWDPLEDAAWVDQVRTAVAGRAVLRVDANQGYSLPQALAFVARVAPEGIELFEQPFPPDEWEAMERLAERSPLPLMLDESIATAADLERQITLGCARWVKFKLAKAGSVAALRTLVARARDAGLSVVLGNGVAGDVDNLHELHVAATEIDTAGEMNGFLKLRARLLANPYVVEGGTAVIPTGYRPELDLERVAAATVDRVVATGRLNSPV